MSIDPAQVQRLNTMIAAMEPKFDEVATAFFDRFEQACPHAKGLRPGSGRRARNEFAASVAMVLKNLANLNAAVAVFEYAENRLKRSGINAADLQTARACLIGAMRDAAGPMWSGEVEADMNTAIGECFLMLRVPVSTPRRVAA